MKFSYINKINYKKLKKYKGKSMFLIIPITFLMSLGIVISSQATNIMEASEQTIFGTAAESGRLIELSSRQVTGGGGGDQRVRMMFGGDTEYNDGDLETIESIDNIEAASLTAAVPINQIATDDLFNDVSLQISNLRSIGQELSAQYTDQNFSYQAGEPIPIILNANTFVRNYEDWGGQDEISIEMGSRQRGDPSIDRQDMENQTPFKFKALSYDKDNLIGKEITISFGGLDLIQTYEQEFTGSGILFRKLTDEQIQEEENQRQEDISTNWDYDKISQPITRTFRVVGVLESESNYASYVPADFVNDLMEEYVKNQLDARTETEIAAVDLNSVWYGLTYDGLELQTSGFGGLGSFRVGPGMIRGMVNNEQEQEDQKSYNIPGLVINTEREEGDTDAFQQRMFGSTGEVIGIYDDPAVYEQAVHSSDTIVIKINDAVNRLQVVEDLNDAGYAYQDLNDQEVFAELQNTLKNVTTIVTISFIILSAIIIILTMGKFVSESTKEIGVFRAIGAKKGDIKQLFMSQAIMYTLIGYIIGALIGIVLVFILAKPVQLWFDAFIENTVEETFAVVQQTSAGIFTHIDWQMFGIYTALLLAIAVVVSIIPATRASRVSPVQAIKNE
ncbi:ABC transporter permease [Patescibacteria group bacterium]|nr:ABC transporter permease [Patescibacteria group bacterium]MBU0964166.1 ABC transporter permease [Patescibacteria group bacterium]